MLQPLLEENKKLKSEIATYKGVGLKYEAEIAKAGEQIAALQESLDFEREKYGVALTVIGSLRGGDLSWGNRRRGDGDPKSI